MKINILILAAGRSNVESERQEPPLCLSEIEGELLIERILDTVKAVNGARYYCAVLEDDARLFHLDDVLRQVVNEVTIVKIPEDTCGSACTALYAAVQMDVKIPLLIMSSNELVKVNMNEVITDFEARRLDAGTLTFRGLHPRYSFVRLDGNSLVEEAAQHRPISKHATAGTFWFARTHCFISATQSLIRKESDVNGKFYIAPILNELILRQSVVGIYPIPQGCYIPLKNERQVNSYESTGR